MNFQEMINELKALIPAFSDLPEFAVKVINNKGRYFGSAEYRNKQMTVRVQKRIMHDYEAVRMVLAHEMVHIWQFHQKYTLRAEVETSHGKDFLRLAKEVNSILGEGYVNIKATKHMVDSAIYVDKMTKVAVFLTKTGEILAAKQSNSRKALTHLNYRTSFLGDAVVYMEIPVNERYKMPILGQGRYVKFTRDEIKLGLTEAA